MTQASIFVCFFCASELVLIISHLLLNLIPTRAPWMRCYYLHFTDEETGLESFKNLPVGTELIFSTWIWIQVYLALTIISNFYLTHMTNKVPSRCCPFILVQIRL
jgi:hypothetical protein